MQPQDNQQPENDAAVDQQRLKRDYERVVEQLQERDQELARVKVLRRDNIESVLGAAGSTEDRCLAMEVMGRALNRQVYELAMDTRVHTASLDSLSAYMTASADAMTAPAFLPSTPAQSTPAPVWNTPLPPPYNAATPSRPTPVVPGRPLNALSTPQPPPYSPLTRERPPRSPATLSVAPSPETRATPRTLARSASAPVASPASVRELFPRSAPPVRPFGTMSAGAPGSGGLVEVRTFLHHVTGSTSNASDSSLLKKRARNDAIVADIVQNRHLTTNSPLRTAASVLVYDATSSRVAVDINAATAGGPSYFKVTSLTKEPRPPLRLPESWSHHDLMVVADNNQVFIFSLYLSELPTLYLSAVCNFDKGAQEQLLCPRVCQIKGSKITSAFSITKTNEVFGAGARVAEPRRHRRAW